jgi:glutamine synthetase
VEHQVEYVLRTVEERGVRFVRLWFTDVLGFLKSVEITPAELEGALEEGMTFDGSTIQGYSRVQESDMLAKPDANTFELLPNNNPDAPVARMFCDIQTFAGEPFDGDPRCVLKRNLERARERGFTFFVGPEMEYFYSRSTERIEPFDTAGYFDLTAHDLGSELRKQTVLRLEAMGIPVEYSFHENGPSQHEIDLRYTDALTMADNLMTFRLIAKEVAHDNGVHATFMPKPMQGAFGSGMHSHLSLFEGDVNAFHDPGDEHGLSKVAKHFIAGLLTHAREITAVTNQWVNSYKRLVPGYEAPVHVAWARNNASVIVNVPHSKRNRAESTRIEYRAPDPACNPYLAYSCVLSAGLRGIEEGYELPDEVQGNLHAHSAEELAANGIRSLPGNLNDAVDLMETSDLVRDALGEHVFGFFIRNKRQEWAEYKTQVSQFELDRYLPRL